MNSKESSQFFSTNHGRILLLLVYFTSVNLLAGYIAVWLKFPSLWGNSRVFGEYAIPMFMTWGLAHWPSLILVGIALLTLPSLNGVQIKRFRFICVGLLLLLLYGVVEKVPFALFPAVDLLVAFFFSLVVVPPSYKENPVFTISLAIFFTIVLFSGMYFSYSRWTHRTPAIKETELMSGLFRLKTITVNKSYRELLFTVELTQYMEPEEVCNTTTEMAKYLFDTYAYDDNYKKNIDVIYNPLQKENSIKAYPLGVVEKYKEDGESQIFCYLKYKK